MLAPARIILAPAQNQFLGAPAALQLLILRHFCIITIGGYGKSLLNSSEYRKESYCVELWAPIEWTWVPSKTQSAGHSFLMDFATGTWIPRNPASTLLRPWFSWPTNIKFRDPNESKLESNPDPVYLRFQNIDFGLWMSRRFPIEVWSDPDTIFRLEAQPIAHRCSKIPRWVSVS